MLDSSIGVVVGMLIGVVDVAARADRGEHLPRGDEVVVCARGDREDGVAQPGGVAAAAEDVLLAHAGGVHDVEREPDTPLLILALLLPRRTGLRGRDCAGERDKWQPAQHGGDALRLADVRGQVVGGDARERQRGQREVQQRGVRGLGVGLERSEVTKRRVGLVRLARGDDAQRPRTGQARRAVCAPGERGGCAGEQRGDGLARRGEGRNERLRDGVAPEGGA